MAVDGTEEGLPVRRLLKQEAQEPLGRNPSPQTRGLHNSLPGSGGGKHLGPPPTPPARKTDAPENPRPPGFEIPFWIFGQSPTFSSIFGCFFGIWSFVTNRYAGQQKWVSGINRNTSCTEVNIFETELFCKPHVPMLVLFHKKSCSASFANFSGCVCALLTAGKGRGPGGGEGGEY